MLLVFMTIRSEKPGESGEHRPFDDNSFHGGILMGTLAKNRKNPGRWLRASMQRFVLLARLRAPGNRE
jgi:hypothetical protein